MENSSILIKNIYYMLSYAFSALRQEEYKDIAAEKFDNIHDLFAEILSIGIGRQIRQGLHREYIKRSGDLQSLRGRIDMRGTIRNQLAQRRALACEYHELSEDNMLNGILKTAAHLLISHGETGDERKAALKRVMMPFADIYAPPPRAIQWHLLRFHRNNSSYQMLIELCRMLLEGMLMTSGDGTHRLASFMDEQRICRLYEKFLLEYYIREQPSLKASSSHIKWALDADEGRGYDLLPAMKSDVMLSRGDDVLIIDAKYYSRTTQQYYDTRKLHSGNLYQIFAYVKNYEALLPNKARKVSGMLLYAQTNDDIRPDASYSMSGSRISVRTLDLNRDFSEIAKTLDGIAEEHFGAEGRISPLL